MLTCDELSGLSSHDGESVFTACSVVPGSALTINLSVQSLSDSGVRG
jgi:hypothetical protein